MKCPLCENEKFKIIYSAHNNKNISSEDFNITDKNYSNHAQIVKCNTCALIYTSPTPTQTELDTYYTQLNDPLYEKESKGRRINFSLILDTLEKQKKNKGHLLDVGCASGIFLDEARNRGWNVMGIDPSQWAKQEAKNKYQLDISNQNFLDYQPTEKFDIITMLDVIEHVNNPRRFLEHCHKLLKDDGILVIITPNIESRIAKFLGEKWWHIRIAHIIYFDESTLANILKRTGFIPCEKTTSKWHFSWNYWHSRVQGMSPMLYNTTHFIFNLIPGYKKHITKKIIPIDFKDSMKWFIIKPNSSLKWNTKNTPLRHKIYNAIITGLYTGYFPIIPATMTSLIYTILAIILFLKNPNTLTHTNHIVLILSVLFSVFLEKFAEEKYRQKDPRVFTLDEIAGLALVFLLIPVLSIPMLISGFLLFRIFDIIKPYPIRHIERLKIRGTIVWDDLFASVYTIIILYIIQFLLSSMT